MTPRELYVRTLNHLQVTAAAESPAPEDTILIRDKYQALYAMLDGESLVDWTSGEDIPSNVAQPLIMMLAAYAAQDFGIGEPRYSQLQAEGALLLPTPSLAERMLRKQIASHYIPKVQATEYF